MKSLPKKTVLIVDRNINIVTEGANALSDEYGFLVKSFDFLVMSKTTQNKIVKFYNINWDISES